MADRLNPSIPQEVSHHRVAEIARNLASLNEMVSALIHGLAAEETIDDSWSQLAFDTLREHNWRLGFTFNEERPTHEWYVKEKQ